jgi:small-conductance mechanosensitive channel
MIFSPGAEYSFFLVCLREFFRQRKKEQRMNFMSIRPRMEVLQIASVYFEVRTCCCHPMEQGANKSFKAMDLQQTQLLESIFILLVYLVLMLAVNRGINNYLKNTPLQRARRKFIIKGLGLFVSITAIVFLAGVWGFRQHEIAAFASTILTALGIAFFAQWSLLSNITSSLILFFNHPLKLGDTVKILDKDCPFEGEVTDLTYFYVHLKTENGEIITIPNSIMFQKPVSVVNQKEKL